MSQKSGGHTPHPNPLPEGEGASHVQTNAGSEVQVEARLESDGRVTPLAVVWQGRRVAVADVGRQWTQEQAGVPHRHVLVMLPNSDRLELALNQHSLTWRVAQTWTTPAAV